jgi:hypothetical protein
MPVANQSIRPIERTEAEFEMSAKAIVTAMASKQPLPSAAFHQHFAVFNSHLIALSSEILRELGVMDSDDVAKASVQSFYREMIATTDFKVFVASKGTLPFRSVAQQALRKICARVSQATDLVGMK